MTSSPDDIPKAPSAAELLELIARRREAIRAPRLPHPDPYLAPGELLSLVAQHDKVIHAENPRFGPVRPVSGGPGAADVVRARNELIWDRLAERYDRVYTGPIDRAEDEIIGDRARRCVWGAPKDGLVVDLACGTGLLLDLVDGFDHRRYRGYDLSTEMLGMAGAKWPSFRFVQHDIRDPLPGDEPVSALLSLFGGASHIPDPLRTLDMQLDRLQIGGRYLFVLFTPAFRYPPALRSATRTLWPVAIPEVAQWAARERFASRYRPQVYGASPFHPPIRLPGASPERLVRFCTAIAQRIAALGTILAPSSRFHRFVCIEGEKQW